MTRETKIGLLVGLAFIIVIGILLSDHINSSTDLAPAAMGKTYDAVERGTASPDSRSDGTMAMVAPAPVIPHNQVPTQREPAIPTDPGQTIVVIGAGGDPSKIRIPARPTEPQNPGVQILPPDNQVATNDSANTGNPAADPNPADPLQKLVQENQNDLVAPGTPPVKVATPNTGTQNNGTGIPAGMRQVKAEEGDTVSKLAAKYLGGNNKNNRTAIIKANPSMTPDGHLVISGRTYLIPGGTVPAPVAISTEQPAAPQPTPAPAPAPKPTPPGVTMYTVKDNDSLWKIAAEQLGSGTRWTEIRDMNQDVLKGTEQVHANMRIKLPAKTVASSN
jgi:nucleoid-associated protein YgaU